MPDFLIYSDPDAFLYGTTNVTSNDVCLYSINTSFCSSAQS